MSKIKAGDLVSFSRTALAILSDSDWDFLRLNRLGLVVEVLSEDYDGYILESASVLWANGRVTDEHTNHLELVVNDEAQE